MAGSAPEPTLAMPSGAAEAGAAAGAPPFTCMSTAGGFSTEVLSGLVNIFCKEPKMMPLSFAFCIDRAMAGGVCNVLCLVGGMSAESLAGELGDAVSVVVKTGEATAGEATAPTSVLCC